MPPLPPRLFILSGSPPKRPKKQPLVLPYPRPYSCMHLVRIRTDFRLTPATQTQIA